MGTFVTKTDLGIGTIVGSAVFNIFGVISVCGLFASSKIPLNWYPITRDCVIYGLTVILLIIVLLDEKVWEPFSPSLLSPLHSNNLYFLQVYWWESLIMIGFYGVYIVLMTFNTRLENWAIATQAKMKQRLNTQTGNHQLFLKLFVSKSKQIQLFQKQTKRGK